MIEFIVEFLFEFVFQALFEILGAFIDGSLHMSERVVKALSKFILYLLLGTILGFMSYKLVPHTVSGAAPNAFLSLAIIPLSVGIFSVFLSRLMERRWDWEVGFSRFSYSLVFAWAFAAMRFMMLNQESVTK